MTTRSTKILLTALLSAATLTPALASGSYSAPKPPPQASATAKLDAEKYRLGKKIYDGKLVLTARGDVETQREPLARLQAQLPSRVQRKRDLADLAGKLSPAQLDALAYFVQHRFAAKQGT